MAAEEPRKVTEEEYKTPVALYLMIGVMVISIIYMIGHLIFAM